MRFRGLLALCVVLLLASAAFAQEQTGSIVGVVKDAQGGVLPGVTVEARSARRRRQHGGDGRAGRLPVPRAASGVYEVTARSPGLQPAKSAGGDRPRPDVKLELTMSVAA